MLGISTEVGYRHVDLYITIQAAAVQGTGKGETKCESLDKICTHPPARR